MKTILHNQVPYSRSILKLFYECTHLDYISLQQIQTIMLENGVQHHATFACSEVSIWNLLPRSYWI